jgi:hypothetical protein
MARTNPDKPRVFIDADVLLAGAAAPGEHRAGLILLRMAEVTLIEACVCQQTLQEAERNLAAALPKTLPVFRLLASRCLQVIPDPIAADLVPYAGLADPQDLPVLAAAVQSGCPWLATYNLHHYRPGHPSVLTLRPGELVLRVRDAVARRRGS